MKTRFAHIAVVLLAGVTAAQAVRPKAADTPAPAASTAPAAAPVKPEDVPPYVLKNRSEFKGLTEDTARVPFWPIGWIKRAKVAQTPDAPVQVIPKVTLDERNFRVTSILLGSGTTPSLAVINGRAYSEGEFLRMPRSMNPAPRVRVQRISDGAVVLQNAEQILTVKLTRPELQNRRPDEMLLDPDR